MGLGPTPQDIGTPGLKAYTLTRLQIQVLACQKAESDNLVLQQCILEMQQREEQRMAREFPNFKTISHHGSNSRQQMEKAQDLRNLVRPISMFKVKKMTMQRMTTVMKNLMMRPISKLQPLQPCLP